MNSQRVCGRAWRALMLTTFFNMESDLYYELFSNFIGKGDKESFAYALAATRTAYSVVSTPVGSVGQVGQVCPPLPCPDVPQAFCDWRYPDAQIFPWCGAASCNFCIVVSTPVGSVGQVGQVCPPLACPDLSMVWGSQLHPLQRGVCP